MRGHRERSPGRRAHPRGGVAVTARSMADVRAFLGPRRREQAPAATPRKVEQTAADLPDFGRWFLVSGWLPRRLTHAEFTDDRSAYPRFRYDTVYRPTDAKPTGGRVRGQTITVRQLRRALKRGWSYVDAPEVWSKA